MAGVDQGEVNSAKPFKGEDFDYKYDREGSKEEWPTL